MVAVAFQGLSFSLFVFVFQGLSFFPLCCWYAALGAVPSVFALASVVAEYNALLDGTLQCTMKSEDN